MEKICNNDCDDCVNTSCYFHRYYYDDELDKYNQYNHQIGED